MKKPLQKKSKGFHPIAEMDPEAFKGQPLIRQFFMLSSYEGEEGERAQGTMILRCDPQRWSVTLKEPTAALQVYLAAPTLKDLWKLVEAALGDEATPWVADPWQEQRQGKKGKK